MLCHEHNKYVYQRVLLVFLTQKATGLLLANRFLP